jgi:phage baseplate assembly protein W
MPAEPSFLGTGWSFPPTFGAGGGAVDMVSGVDDIRQSLEILLATRPGERVMQDEFGCELTAVLFEEIDQGLINALTGLIADAILYHEPRIELDRLDISEDQAAEGLLLISLDYTVRNTNARFNMVYPFYLNEATTSGLA